MAKWAAFGVDPSGQSDILETWLCDTKQDAQGCTEIIVATWGADINIYVEPTTSEKVISYFGLAEARRMQNEEL